VAILDADKAGFLRSETSLIQTMGRAARHVHGQVVLYADTVTPAMEAAIRETERRRAKQTAFNEEHEITPQGITREISDVLLITQKGPAKERKRSQEPYMTEKERAEAIERLEKEMKRASDMLEFEYAALLRDQIIELRGEKRGKK